MNHRKLVYFTHKFQRLSQLSYSRVHFQPKPKTTADSSTTDPVSTEEFIMSVSM